MISNYLRKVGICEMKKLIPLNFPGSTMFSSNQINGFQSSDFKWSPQFPTEISN